MDEPSVPSGGGSIVRAVVSRRRDRFYVCSSTAGDRFPLSGGWDLGDEVFRGHKVFMRRGGGGSCGAMERETPLMSGKEAIGCGRLLGDVEVLVGVLGLKMLDDRVLVWRGEVWVECLRCGKAQQSTQLPPVACV